MGALNQGPHGDVPWWAVATAEASPAGCCAACPVAGGCPLRSQSAVRCAVTGDQPPRPPASAPDAGESAAWDEAVAVTASASWTQFAADVADRAPSSDAEGTPVDWSRLQPARNLLSIVAVSFVPFADGTTAARWVAETIASGGIIAPVFAPLGAVVAVTGSAFLGQLAPGPFGVLCALAFKTLTGTARRLWRLVRSPLGWIITRPALWAAGIGVLIVSWRAVLRFLTGA
ncbi:hypothetical protein [Streptomyces sp. NPDC006879]|uniref:hypothetical protein n=1 Tax=Streptomyces sp. NPDC006879 TaxID=3364767 RepID=UPI00368C9492